MAARISMKDRIQALDPSKTVSEILIQYGKDKRTDVIIDMAETIDEVCELADLVHRAYA